MSSSEREDYLLRQLRGIGAMLARIAGLRVAGQIEEAVGELDAAYRELLGPNPALLLDLDSETAALLVGDPQKLTVLAQLVREDGRLLEMRGDDGARSREHHALTLALEAVRRDGRMGEARRIVLELGPSADEGTLTEKQRETLRRILNGAGPTPS